MSKEYETPELKEAKIQDLFKKLDKHANDARALYKEIQTINKDLQINLFNTQFVIDWQDCLNEISITKEEDV